MKPEKAPVPKGTAGYNYTCHQEPRPVLQSEDMPINSTGEAEKKTKFNFSTTNKGTEIKTDLKTLFDYAVKLENTRTKLERTI